MTDMLPSAIAIPAKHLQVFRVSDATNIEPHAAGLKLSPVSLSVSIDVIESQKARIVYSAARTLPAIVCDYFQAYFATPFAQICRDFFAVFLLIPRHKGSALSTGKKAEAGRADTTMRTDAFIFSVLIVFLSQSLAVIAIRSPLCWGPYLAMVTQFSHVVLLYHNVRDALMRLEIEILGV